jgi:hypothetical protein
MTDSSAFLVFFLLMCAFIGSLSMLALALRRRIDARHKTWNPLAGPRHTVDAAYSKTPKRLGAVVAEAVAKELKSFSGLLSELIAVRGWAWCMGRRLPVAVALLVGIVLFLRFVRTDYPISGDELITAGWSEPGQVLESYRFGHNVPLPPMVDIFVTSIFGDGVFGHRLMPTLVGAAAVILFYLLLRYILSENPGQALALGFIAGTNLLLLHYSHEVGPYAYVLLFALTSFYVGYRVFVTQDAGWWAALLLAVVFALWPLTHYLAWLHMVALFVALGASAFLFGTLTLAALCRMALLGLVVLLAYVPWADGAWAYGASQLAYASDSNAVLGSAVPVIRQGLTLTGGNNGWAEILLAWLVVAGASAGIVMFALSLSGRIELRPFDRFVVVMLVYVVVFLGLYSWRPPSEEFSAWRHILHLVWPMLIFATYALHKLASVTGPMRVWRQDLVSLLVAALVVSNLIGSTGYLLSNSRGI